MSQPENLANMPVNRMRMRPWLKNLIDSASVDGVTWIDEEKTMFSIPWKHAARHGWEMEKDASLFKKWAIHTGKYVEGKAGDPKTWKANFRCAMNSLPDIKELKDMSVNKGHQAMRVFKMLPAAPKAKDKRGKAKRVQRMRRNSIKSEDQTDSESQSSVAELMRAAASPQENTVDSTVNTELQEFEFNSPELVPDVSMCIELGNTGYDRMFQLSPDYIPDDSDYELSQITKLIEGESKTYSFMTSESCMSPYSMDSDTSEEEVPKYTVLGDDMFKLFL